MKRGRLTPVVAVVAIALGTALPLRADDDEPGRGVARISVLSGDVSVRRGDSGDFVAAAVNAPLVVQDRLLTGINSRAELQFDYANFLRISHNAEVRLAELENARYLVQVARGTVTWRVLRDRDTYVEISTPAVSVRPVRKGTYRITVLDDGAVEITVRSGEAEIFTPRGSERLKSGRTMLARGSASDPEFRVADEIPDDDWDRWNIARDRDLERTRSYQYLSQDIYGADDLDHHGRWVQVPSHGWVWSPRVAVGWAPYRHGRWVWMDWYGWTWVSYDPWGWAPYHYGRWFHTASYGWCWWPGGRHVRHRWSPGLVAFFGFGRVGVGVGWGRVGWVPIGPHEPFHPWWGRRYYGGYRNRNYFDNSVTVVNNVNITTIYRNSRVNNSVTVVDGDGFRRGRSVDGNHVRIQDSELRTASLTRGPVPLAPERDSMRFADRDVRVAAGRDQERFFSNRRPAAVERVSFEEQRQGVERIARRSFDESPGTVISERSGTRAASSDERRGSRAAENLPANTDGGTTNNTRAEGWRRFGSPRTGAPGDAVSRGDAGTRLDAAEGTSRAEAAGSRSDASDEWRRFGSTRSSSDNFDTRREPTGRSGRSESMAGSEGWRRFGAERTERDATGTRVAPEASGQGWRRLDNDNEGRATSSTDSRAERSNSGRSSSTDFGVERRSNESRVTRSQANVERPREVERQEEPRSEAPAWRNPEPRPSRSERSGSYDSGGRRAEAPSRNTRGDFGAGGGERIRISPPIVRERSDSGPRGMSSGGGDGGGRAGRAEGLSRSGGGRGR